MELYKGYEWLSGLRVKDLWDDRWQKEGNTSRRLIEQFLKTVEKWIFNQTYGMAEIYENEDARCGSKCVTICYV